jgi:hypothetical protein
MLTIKISHTLNKTFAACSVPVHIPVSNSTCIQFMFGAHTRCEKALMFGFENWSQETRY